MKHGLFLLLALFLFTGASDLLAQQRQVSGRVVSATGEPIAGADVVLRGTTIRALTGVDGAFRIEVPTGRVTLVVSFLGYRTEAVTLETGEATANVTLQPDPLRLEELVVVGRATEISRRNLPNAVATVSAEEMERAPAESIEKSIQGKVAGALIETNSGAPGGGVQVRLRGVSTINAQSTPLYVVDGVIISDVAIPSNQNEINQSTSGSNPAQTQDNQVNRVADINPQDIERIEILKGAAAAAIFGQKASNGVVVITTKRGRPGRPRIRLSQRFGFFDLRNTIGGRNWDVDEAVAQFGPAAADFFGADGQPLQTFDQEQLLAGRNDLSFETSASVSGGTETTQYFASALWKNDEGIIENTGFEKQSLRVNLTQQIGPRIQVQATTNLIHTLAERGLSNNDNAGTSYWIALTQAPNFVDLRRDPETGLFPDSPFGTSNPLQTATLSQNDEDVWRFIGGVNTTWEAIQGRSHNVRLLANFGVDWFGQENDLFFPPELQFEVAEEELAGTSLLSNSNNLNLNIGINGVYTFTPAGGGWTATTSAGFQYEDRDLSTSRIVARGLNAGNQNVSSGRSVGVKEFRQKVRDQGFYLQEEWLGVNERLLLSAGGRFDRSSTFGDEGTFSFYPKAAVSYRFPNLTGWIEELKLRVAWGQAGNLPLFGQKFSNVTLDQNIEGNLGLVLSDTLGNPELVPERQNEVEAGFDLSASDGRASLEFTVYQKNITDLLLTRTTATSLGFRQEISNGGELRARGVEAALAATPVQTEGLTWLFRTTFFLDRAVVTDLPVPSFRSGGFSTSLGAFQIAEGESPTQLVGEIAPGDVQNLGDANPNFHMTFANEVQIGRINVYGLFDWRSGGEILNLTNLLWDLRGTTGDFETTGAERLAAFFEGDIRGYVESATYLKLRELTVSYDLPTQFMASLFGGVVERARLSFSARNLLTFDKYSGLDTEVSNFGNQPVGRNVSVAPFPPSRSFWFGIDLNL